MYLRFIFINKIRFLHYFIEAYIYIYIYTPFWQYSDFDLKLNPSIWILLESKPINVDCRLIKLGSFLTHFLLSWLFHYFGPLILWLRFWLWYWPWLIWIAVLVNPNSLCQSRDFYQRKVVFLFRTNFGYFIPINGDQPRINDV